MENTKDRNFKNFISIARKKSTSSAFFNLIRGVKGYELKKCIGEPICYTDMDQILLISPGSIICGRLTSVSNNKTFYFGLSEIKRNWVDDDGNKSLVLNMWKSSDGKCQFLNKKSFKDPEVYVWTNIKEEISDTEIDEVFNKMLNTVDTKDKIMPK